MEGQGKCDLSLTNEKDCIIIDELLVSSRVKYFQMETVEFRNSHCLLACLWGVYEYNLYKTLNNKSNSL